jgi:hypothetical protein
VLRDTSQDGSSVDIYTLTIKEFTAYPKNIVALGEAKFALFFFTGAYSANATIVTMDANKATYSIQQNVIAGNLGVNFIGGPSVAPWYQKTIYMKTHTNWANPDITRQTIDVLTCDANGNFSATNIWLLALKEGAGSLEAFAWLAPPQWHNDGALALWIRPGNVTVCYSWYIYTPETREVTPMFPMLTTTDETYLYVFC